MHIDSGSDSSPVQLLAVRLHLGSLLASISSCDVSNSLLKGKETSLAMY